MTVFLVIYFILLLLVLIYVAVNIYHLVRFRLDVPGDKSAVALVLYLVIVVAILVGSAMMAVVAARL